MPILVTGCAGFIGYHTVLALIKEGETVIGLDNLNTYYDVSLKQDRLKNLDSANFTFVKADLAESEALDQLFAKYQPQKIIHLAAQAGVRYSLKHPETYVQSNLVGFANLLEVCRKYQVEHLVFASSSSVYGLNKKIPYSPHDAADHPVSLYAATKKSNELMAHVYSHLYDLPCTGLRFFTVYGPFGRPDMSPYIFTNALLRDETIALFNSGQMRRDFTYIEDIVTGICKVLPKPPKHQERTAKELEDPSLSTAPWGIYNIGNNQPIPLRQFVQTLEELTGKKAKIELKPMQPGDVEATWADTDDFSKTFGAIPHTPLQEGLREYVRWFREYYKI